MRLFEKGDYIKAQLEFKNAVKIDPKFAKGYYMIGLCAYKLKNLNAAFRNFNTAIELNPNLFDAQLKIGFIYILAKNPEEALKKAELVLEKESHNAQALLLKATALKFQGKKEEAVKILQDVISIDPKNAEAYITLAQLYGTKKDFALLEKTLKMGLSKIPNHIGLNLALASFYEAQGRLKEAESFYKKIIELSKKEDTQLLLVGFYARTKMFAKAKQVITSLIKSYPNNYKYKFTLASILLDEKKPTEAEGVLKKTIEEFPKEPEVYLFLANVYRQQGKEEAYITTLKKCVKSVKESPLVFKAHNLLAAFYLEKGKSKLAFDEINAVLEKNPRDLEAHYLKAKYHLKEKEANSAITELRFVLKERPKFLEAHRLLAKAYFMNGQIALAEDTLKEALKIEEKDLDSRFFLAQIYLRKHALKEAEKELKKILEVAPKHIPTLIMLGDVHFMQGEIKKAKEEYSKALNIDKQNALIYYKLGVVEKKQGNFTEAIKHFEKALKVKKDFLEAFVELVRCYIFKKEYKKAIAECKKYLALIPRYKFYIQNLLGEAYLKDGDLKEAENAFLEAVSIKPEAISTYYNLAQLYKHRFPQETAKNYKKLVETRLTDSLQSWFILAMLYEQEENYKEVESCYKHILNKNPNQVEAANNLAFLYAEKLSTKGNLKKAIELIEQVIKRYPKQPDFLDTYGWICYRMGNHEKALSVLREAIRINSKPIYHYHLGMVYKEMGQLALAKAELTIATKSKTNFPGKELALKTLKEINQGGR